MTTSPAPGTGTDSASATGAVADAAFWAPKPHVEHQDWIGFLGAEPAEPAEPEHDVVDPARPTAPATSAVLDLDALLAGTSDDLLPER